MRADASLLAGAYAATSCCSARRSARGSAWVDRRRRRCVAAAAFRPLRARRAGRRGPAVPIRARYDALAPGRRASSRTCAPGSAEPEDGRGGAPRRCSTTRRWSCGSCCAGEPPTSTRAARPAGPARRRPGPCCGRARRHAARRGALATRARTSTARCCARSSPPPAWPIEIARLRVELRRQLARGRGVARADRRRRPTRSAAGSSATCTTARSSGWCPIGLALRHAQHELESDAARQVEQDARRRGRPRSPPRSTSCASWRTGCRRRSSTPGSRAALRELAGARRRCPSRSTRARRAVRARRRGGRVLHRLRGADERRQARPGRAASRCTAVRRQRQPRGQRRRRRRGRRRAAAGSGLRGPRRPGGRARRHAPRRQRPRARAPTLVAELPCAS